MKKITIFCMLSIHLFLLPFTVHGDGDQPPRNHAFSREILVLKKSIPENSARFSSERNYHFPYPDAVRGIYVTGQSAGGKKFQELVQFIENTELNAMVIDMKDDWGNLTFQTENESLKDISKNYIHDIDQLLKTLENKQIYPIARIVVFKDSVLAEKKPEWSFKIGNQVWKNQRGESFVNPFLKEVWDYNVNIAKEVAKIGFREIQFDYVRFPEGFEKREEEFSYNFGEYEQLPLDNVQKRVKAVTDFVAYAREQLKPYDIKISVDIFGYSATIPEAPGIGQNFSKICEHVDVISAMIYPSHWTPYFGIAKPDLEPYRLVKEYIKVEKDRLAQLKNPPISRPWLQDFTATWLGKGNYKPYGKKEVEDQIRALKEEGIHEFLLWNPANKYTPNVDYKLDD